MQTREELINAATREGLHVDLKRIAVAGLTFSEDGHVFLIQRGGEAKDEVEKLEGIGGRVGDRENLHSALLDEFHNEVPIQGGRPCDVRIGDFLDLASITFTAKNGAPITWVVATYICELKDAQFRIGEPDRIFRLYRITLRQLFEWPHEGGQRSMFPNLETAQVIAESKSRKAKPKFFDDTRLPGLSPWTVRIRQIYREKYGSESWPG